MSSPLLIDERPLMPPLAATLRRELPAAAFAMRADFPLLSPCSRSFW